MRELRLLRDLRWPAAAVGAELETESEREGTWKELRREMKWLRGRLLLVMEPARLRGCMAMGNHFNFYMYIPDTCVLYTYMYMYMYMEAATVCSGSPEERLRQLSHY